jgi:hypothetical protein
MGVRRLFAPFKPPKTLVGVRSNPPIVRDTRRVGRLLWENSMLTSSSYLTDIAPLLTFYCVSRAGIADQ